jgi:hypothetical protein
MNVISPRPTEVIDMWADARLQNEPEYPYNYVLEFGFLPLLFYLLLLTVSALLGREPNKLLYPLLHERMLLGLHVPIVRLVVRGVKQRQCFICRRLCGRLWGFREPSRHDNVCDSKRELSEEQKGIQVSSPVNLTPQTQT